MLCTVQNFMLNFYPGRERNPPISVPCGSALIALEKYIMHPRLDHSQGACLLIFCSEPRPVSCEAICIFFSCFGTLILSKIGRSDTRCSNVTIFDLKLHRSPEWCCGSFNWACACMLDVHCMVRFLLSCPPGREGVGNVVHVFSHLRHTMQASGR